MKVSDLHYMEQIYNREREIGDIIANLWFPQKYITLEYDGEFYNLELVSVDDYEFIVRVVDNVEDGRR